MKSGLSENEKLKALRIFVDDYDQNNSKLHEIAQIEKQINFLERSGLKTPYQLITMHSISDQEREQNYGRHYRNRKHRDYRARQTHDMNVQNEKDDPEDECLLEGRPPDEYLPYAKHIDAMRVAVCYTGNPKRIIDATLNYHHLKAVLRYW